MAKKKNKCLLDDAVKEVREAGMTYAEFQAAETMNLLKYGKKEGAKGGRCKVDKNNN